MKNLLIKCLRALMFWRKPSVQPPAIQGGGGPVEPK